MSNSPVDYITKSITDLNVPDCPVDSLSPKFVYNFFVPNEKIDDSGVAVDDGGSATQLQALITNGTVLKTMPRYVILEWATPERFTSNQVDLFIDEGSLIDLQQAGDGGLINRETDVTIDGRDVIVYQDKDLVKQITTLVDTTALFRLGSLPGTGLSQNEVLNPMREAASQRFSFQVDRTILRDLTDQQARNPFSSDCVFSLLDRQMIETYQANQLLTDSGGIDLEADFEPVIQTCAVSSGVTSYSPPTLKVVGYVVEKFELFKDGRRELKETMYVSNPLVTQTLDTKIKYGSSYAYTVSTVCLLSFTQAVVTGGSGGTSSSTPGLGSGRGGTTTMAHVSCLVRSRRSSERMVSCVEEVPPSAPNGITFSYNFDKESLYIEWQNPVDRQNDIKKIQLFRRASINDPFTVIAQYDFDDSAIKTSTGEFVNSDINFVSSGPVAHHVDRDFTRPRHGHPGMTEGIYALCAIDAHGMTSNYSIQYHVKYDNMKNTVVVKRISAKGAPKQYPNAFLDPRLDKNISSQRLLEDKMADSRRYSMRVYFDPEYLQVNDGNGEDLKLLTYESTGTYKFLVLNLDRQRTRMLTFTLQDKRTPLV